MSRLAHSVFLASTRRELLNEPLAGETLHAEILLCGPNGLLIPISIQAIHRNSGIGNTVTLSSICRELVNKSVPREPCHAQVLLRRTGRILLRPGQAINHGIFVLRASRSTIRQP